MTKIIGLCASPRHASSEYVAEQALKAAAAFDPRIETELISFSGKRIDPCVDCGYCKSHKSWCVKKDDVQDILDKVVQASGIIVVSPVYVMSATPQFHAFCSRMRPLMHCFPELVRNKFFAAVSVGGTRNGGEETTINDIMRRNVIYRYPECTGRKRHPFRQERILSRCRSIRKRMKSVC